MKIGVDVGGTNTDAVVMGSDGVLGWQKTPTTPDVYSGIVTAIRAAKQLAGTTPDQVDCVMIGTTQFTNAVIERRSLLPVGVVRLALPAASAIQPYAPLSLFCQLDLFPSLFLPGLSNSLLAASNERVKLIALHRLSSRWINAWTG